MVDVSHQVKSLPCGLCVRSVVIAPVDRRAWSEAAAELRSLSIRLHGYVAELPSQSLPPRGRVQWSSAEVEQLGVLTRVLARSEDAAARAALSLEAIDTLFRRARSDAAALDFAVGGDSAIADERAGATLLGHYLAQRAIALDSLPRLQRVGDSVQGAVRNARPPRRAAPWRLFWTQTLAKLTARRPR